MAESSVPKPVSAYVGLIVASLEDARGAGRSPVAQAVRLPLAAAGQLFTAHHRYDALAEQGEVIIEAVVGIMRERFGSGDPDADLDAEGWLGDESAAAREWATEFPEPVTETLIETVDGLTDPTPPDVRSSPMEQLESFGVASEVGAEAGGLKSAADLPLADFDHMRAAQLRGRLRTLDPVGLVQLLDYERAHAHRVAIIVMLENRLAKLHAADGSS